MKKRLFDSKNIYKSIALLLCLVLAFEAIPLLSFAETVGESYDVSNDVNVDTNAAADTNSSESTQSNEYQDEQFALGEGELPQSQLKKLKPENVQRPESISLEKAIQSGHVNRLTAQEKDLRVVMFQNQDTSKTTYVYDKPVKYVDALGTVRDKSTAISRTEDINYAYEMTQNSFQAYFGKFASAGVKIDYQNYSFSMIPKTSLLISTPTISEDARSIVYTGAFGKNTALRYQTQISGIKEDIILMSDVGEYAFEFLLSTNATPSLTESGTWVLLNGDGEKIADFGKIIVNDSSGKAVLGGMEIVPRTNGEYTVTVTVPEAFLKNSTTAYPVYIDPTVIIDETDVHYWYEGSERYETEYTTIYDIGLCKDDATYNAAIAGEERHILSEGSGEIVYQFYDFIEEDGQFYDLSPYRIGRVTMYFTSALQSRATYTIYPMTSFVSNEFLAVKDATLFDAYSQNNSTSVETVATYDDTIAMDITKIARGWASFNMGYSDDAWNNPANGFVLVQTDSVLGADWIYSTEADGDSNVYYEIVTSSIGGLYAIRNIATNQYLGRKEGTAKDVTLTNLGSPAVVHEGAYWIIDYKLNGKYTITLFSKPRYALSATALAEPFYENNVAFKDAYDNTLRTLPTNPSDLFYWNILSANGGGVILKNCSTGKVLTYGTYYSTHFPAITTERPSSAENYSQTVFGITRMDDHTVGTESFTRSTQDETSWIDIGNTYVPTLAIQPTNSSFGARNDFYWSSEDTDVATVDENGVIRGVANGYTNITIESKGNGKRITFPIIVGQLVPNGTYRIRKAGEQKYVTLMAGTIRLVNRNANPNVQNWDFFYLGQGYYRIRLTSGMLLGAKEQVRPNDFIAGLGSTSQVMYIWRLEISENGNYRFIAPQYEASEIALAKAPTSNDIRLHVRTIDSSSSTSTAIAADEWVVERDHQVSIIAIPETYDRDTFFDTAETFLSDLGYTDIYAEERCMNDEFLKSYMSNSEVVIIRTHGTQKSISTSHNPIEATSSFSISNLNLQGVDLVVYGACLTGANPEGANPAQNLAQATVNAGATTVVGFNTDVKADATNDWCAAFTYWLGQGWSVSDAAIQACDFDSIHDDDFLYRKTSNFPILAEQVVICGDGDLTLSSS